jgi:hypothetical protein
LKIPLKDKLRELTIRENSNDTISVSVERLETKKSEPLPAEAANEVKILGMKVIQPVNHCFIESSIYVDLIWIVNFLNQDGRLISS